MAAVRTAVRTASIIKAEHSRRDLTGATWTVRLFTTGGAVLYRQPTNPRTGKGWQKRTNAQTFVAHHKAMWAWLRAGVNSATARA